MPMSIFNPVSPFLPEFLLHGAVNESHYLSRKLESRAGAAAGGKDTMLFRGGLPCEFL